MAIKTITVCDGCERELKERKEMYYLDFNTDAFLDGAGDTDYNSINLVFCEKCAKNIKTSLEIIVNKNA
jgi:hypothetical protein